MDIADIKRKLRELKKLENKIRFGGEMHVGLMRSGKKTVWDEFFSTGGIDDARPKYNLRRLASMDREELKVVYEEFFYNVWYRKYADSGLFFTDVYDPQLLSLLGLPPGSPFEDIKARFRSLAKKYHPDTGGDAESMIGLLDTYHKLKDRNK